MPLQDHEPGTSDAFAAGDSSGTQDQASQSIYDADMSEEMLMDFLDKALMERQRNLHAFADHEKFLLSEEDEQERLRAEDAWHLPEFLPIDMTALIDGKVLPEEHESGSPLVNGGAQVANAALFAEPDLGGDETGIGVPVNALAAGQVVYPSAGGASRAAVGHGVQAATRSAQPASGGVRQRRRPGGFTMPALPSWKWMAAALVLAVVATLVAYVSNAGVIVAVRHAPLVVAPIRHAHPTPTPISHAHPTPTPVMTVTATSQPKPTPTPHATAKPQPTPTPYPTSVPTPIQPPDFYTQATSGKPVYSSSMVQPDGARWGVSGKGGVSCGYTSSGYQISDNDTGTFFPCSETGIALSNFTFQVEMVITSGNGGGVIFRQSSTAASEYRFRLSSNGTYDLGGPDMSLISGSSAVVHTGVNQSNLLTIIARGANLYVYINRQRILSITTANAAIGIFGLFAVDFAQPTTALFKSIEIW